MNVTGSYTVSVPLIDAEEKALQEVEGVDCTVSMRQLYIFVKAAFAEGRDTEAHWQNTVAFKRFLQMEHDINAAAAADDEEEDE